MSIFDTYFMFYRRANVRHVVKKISNVYGKGAIPKIPNGFSMFKTDNAVLKDAVYKNFQLIK